jgi:hypothetical protein
MTNNLAIAKPTTERSSKQQSEALTNRPQVYTNRAQPYKT